MYEERSYGYLENFGCLMDVKQYQCQILSRFSFLHFKSCEYLRQTPR
jgi:hypothetical protein